MNTTNSKFPLGQIVITKNALGVLDNGSVNKTFLTKYINCDWGELCEEDKKLNDEALIHGDRILAAYRDANGTKFWIITEHDRSCTTILMPEDY